MIAPALAPLETTTALPTALVCAGCGYRAPGRELHLRCPNARPGDDIDHVIQRVIDPARVEWPAGGEPNPFIRYRTLFHWYHVARAAGIADDAIVEDVARLDDAVARVDGRGFRVTPFDFCAGLDAWVKDETNNVSGSHKARHLFGTLLALRFMSDDATGATSDIGAAARPLAIASCGNAALAAAVVARAAERRLEVFVPLEADGAVVAAIKDLGAEVTVCDRGAGETGDPSVRRMREAVAAGAIAFTCQGDQNGVAIEGGLTLGYEIADALANRVANGHEIRLDNLFVQVGGGALASSVIQALDEAWEMGALRIVPRLYPVQTAGVAPLANAYRLVREQLAGWREPTDVLYEVARNRSRYMRPWSPIRPSIASGILDDETYDWLAIVRAMVETGGRPLVVDEAAIADANRRARDASSINVDPTGSAGLAGLLALRASGEMADNESSAVLFTGALRS